MAKKAEMKKLDIEDKKVIKGRLTDFQIQASELSFTNLYAWRNKYQFHYMILNDFLWLVNIKEDIYYLSQPIGNYEDIEGLYQSINFMKDYLKDRPFIMKKVEEKFVDILMKSSLSSTFKAIRDDYDYLYDYTGMKELSGKTYRKKKNHINQFLKKYTWHYEVMSEKNFADVKRICDLWFDDVNDEKMALDDVLDHFDYLDVTGGVLYVENKPVSFIIGERLNQDTLVIHFEKGDNNYHGVYPMVFHEYIQDKLGFKYINREQDLGIPGLRKSKLSYHPVDFVKKYNVTII
ncbi:DUF2156 domain-containing protein [Acidaminobacter sp. JC074]|uniref:DUF2156 domain-containing protein n=1 Tax=Acidaminobacter sp. JC074 TaxID=2530199 RepID=UPI001F0E035C|nr:DUF2156 domain-containing protein [Acidaminobacter sp. JC074]MCH4889860.1 DUF2156 domain-containing protein [Acidaminobacter sp. JC074]